MTASASSVARRHGLIMAMLLVAGSVAGAPPPVITGEVRALQAQSIYTPPSNSSPVVLRYYIADGSEVKPGDPLLRIDPGQAAQRLRFLVAEIEKAEARGAKEIAELEVKAIDAELALVDAEATLAKARIDAAIPRELVTGLDFDRYRGELQRAEREHQLKQAELIAARNAVVRRRSDSALEVERMRLEQRFQQVQLEASEVRADRAGVVLHGPDVRTGLRFDEGSSAQPGQLVGEVVTPGSMAVRGYALETERHHFERGDTVGLEFDALPGVRLQGTIEAISGAPEPRPLWGDGRYFVIDILLDETGKKQRLLPGMSVRIRPAALQVISEARQ